MINSSIQIFVAVLKPSIYVTLILGVSFMAMLDESIRTRHGRMAGAGAQPNTSIYW